MISLAVIKAFMWIAGPRVAARFAPFVPAAIGVIVAVALFSLGYSYAAGRCHNAAELAALRSQVAAHELANGLREAADAEETKAAAEAADAWRNNTDVWKEGENAPSVYVPVCLTGDFLNRLRRIK